MLLKRSLTVSDRPAVILEADLQSIEQAGNKWTDGVWVYFGTELGDASTRSLPYCVVIRLGLRYVKIYLSTKIIRQWKIL